MVTCSVAALLLVERWLRCGSSPELKAAGSKMQVHFNFLHIISTSDEKDRDNR
jgi:hypothetical protein